MDVNSKKEFFRSSETDSKRFRLSYSLSQLVAITFKTKMLEAENRIITLEIYCTINKANMRKRYIVFMQICFMGTPKNLCGEIGMFILLRKFILILMLMSFVI